MSQQDLTRSNKPNAGLGVDDAPRARLTHVAIGKGPVVEVGIHHKSLAEPYRECHGLGCDGL
jgi:hypothetical protein